MSCGTHPQWYHDAADCPFCLVSRTERDTIREVINADLKLAQERVLTLELENQRLVAEREALKAYGRQCYDAGYDEGFKAGRA
jgi:hypothetical protein